MPAPAAEPPPAPAETAYERSLALVRTVLARRPDDPAVFQVLAEVHFRRGRFREAIAVCEEALRRAPRSTELLFAAAESYVELEEYERALEKFRGVLSVAGSGPLAARARVGSAQVHHLQSRHEEAAAELRAAIAAGDRAADTYYRLGRALEARARGLAAADPGAAPVKALDEEAASALETAVRADPGHRSAYYVLAAVRRRQGREEEARRQLAAFRRLKPRETELERSVIEKAEPAFEARTAVRLARVLFEAGDAESALGLVRHARAVHPDFTEALAYEGWIALRQGKHEEARAAFEAILAREPEHAEALWNLGKVHLGRGDAGAAAPLLLRATEKRKTFAEGWELLARLALEQGVYAERAEEFARHAFELRPSPRNCSMLAMALHARGDLAGSQRVLAEGVRRFPEDPELRAGYEALTGAGGQTGR